MAATWLVSLISKPADAPGDAGWRAADVASCYVGEGFTNAWFKGRLYREVDGAMAVFNALCDTQPARCTGRVVEPTQSKWWIQVRSRGNRVGWTNEPEKFDGKDQFGA